MNSEFAHGVIINLAINKLIAAGEEKPTVDEGGYAVASVLEKFGAAAFDGFELDTESIKSSVLNHFHRP